MIKMRMNNQRIQWTHEGKKSPSEAELQQQQQQQQQQNNQNYNNFSYPPPFNNHLLLP